MYPRKTPYLFGPFSIRRVYCKSCKTTHALLPCFIIPYARVLDVVREAAIAGICFNTHTIEELAEIMGVDPTTVARWWRIFRNKAGTLMMALVRELADSSQLSDWASGSIRTAYDESKKILELIGRCRATYSPAFAFSNFAWVNILNPYLLFES
jgi:transposase-like protein